MVIVSMKYTVVVFAPGGNPMAQFGSQDVAAMTNHHLSFFLFLNVLFNRGQSHKLRYKNKKKEKEVGWR